MNRRLLPVVAVVAIVGLGGILGLYGVLPDGAGAAPDDGSPADSTPTPGAQSPVSLTTDGESLTLSTTAEEVVHGETSLDAGTQLVVRLQSTNSTQPFLRSAETTVTDDGTFRTTFDLSSISSGGTVRTTVRHDGEELLNTTGHLDVVESEPTNDTDGTDGTGDDSPARLTGDGDLTLRTVDGERVAGETDLDPGTNVTVRLRSSGENPFLVSETTTVSEDGSFEATLDLGNLDAIENGTEADLLLLADGEELLNTTATMVQTGASETTPSDGDDGPFVRLVTVDGGDVIVSNTTEQVVRGETDLEPGTDLTVRLRSSGENPFLASDTVTVSEDGTFRATFDLSNVTAPAEFEATVRRDDETLATADGQVVRSGTEPTAELDFEGDRLTLANETGQVVSGETSVEAGETILVRIHGAGESPFIQSREATVTENGTFRTTFDLSEVPADATFRVYVQYDDERLTYAPGTFGDD